MAAMNRWFSSSLARRSKTRRMCLFKRLLPSHVYASN